MSRFHITILLAIILLGVLLMLGAGGVPSNGGIVDEEIADGSVDGSNKSFTSVNAPNPESSGIAYLYCARLNDKRGFWFPGSIQPGRG